MLQKRAFDLLFLLKIFEGKFSIQLNKLARDPLASRILAIIKSINSLWSLGFGPISHLIPNISNSDIKLNLKHFFKTPFGLLKCAPSSASTTFFLSKHSMLTACALPSVKISGLPDRLVAKAMAPVSRSPERRRTPERGLGGRFISAHHRRPSQINSFENGKLQRFNN